MPVLSLTKPSIHGGIDRTISGSNNVHKRAFSPAASSTNSQKLSPPLGKPLRKSAAAPIFAASSGGGGGLSAAAAWGSALLLSLTASGAAPRASARTIRPSAARTTPAGSAVRVIVAP